jgi:DNA polymerase
MQTIVLDTETRSEANLRDVGAYVYAQHPSTSPLCLVHTLDDTEPDLWLPPNPVPPLFFRIAEKPGEYEVFAHNAMFDAAIYDFVLVPIYGFPPLPLEVWHCSQRIAMANGLPAELDRLAVALGLPYRKDPEARKAMLAVSKPKQKRGKKGSNSGKPVFDDDPAKLALTYERCKLDAITTRAAVKAPAMRRLSPTERRYQLQDWAINLRGVRIDRAFVEAARDLSVRERIAINLRLQELTDGGITSVDQVARLLKAVNERGHHMTTLSKRAVTQVLAGKPDGFVAELLTLRRDGARASVRKFKRLGDYAADDDDRIRLHLRMYGAGPGRWAGLGPQLQNLKKNEASLPLSVVDSVRRGERAEIAKYGNPLGLLGDISRASLCARVGYELKAADYSAIESIVLAWYAGETWKLDAYREFQRTGDTSIEPYRVVARRMLRKPADAVIDKPERQTGKGGELACGFGGNVGAWRRIIVNDPRSDAEIKVIVMQWRAAHPATVKFWRDLDRAIRVAIRTGEKQLVAPAPQPPITASFEDGTLALTLPSGRAIYYPGARLVPGKFEDGPPNVEFWDNAKGQWKRKREWFGTFVENVVQGTARELLAAAIDRVEAHGWPVVLHCHDEITIEVPLGTVSDAEFLAVMLEAPAWAAGMPLGGAVHSGAHYLEPPEEPAVPRFEAEMLVEQAVDCFIDREDIGEIDDPDLVEAEDEADIAANASVPLTELVTLPMAGCKVLCPFHAEEDPSCTIYVDHYHCYGCGAHGSRLDWLVQAEGLSESEAIALLAETPEMATFAVPANQTDTLIYVERLWDAAQPIRSTIAERYLDETRGIDLTKLPENVADSLRYDQWCVFGPGRHEPCLVALMRDPETDAITGVQRVGLRVGAGDRIEKIDRMMLGTAGVVKIWPPGETLVIGEGLETVLAAATRLVHTGVPLRPTWAALSAGKMRTLPPIAGVKRLIVLADNDANGEGQTAAAHIAAVWRAARIEVSVLTPPGVNTDFNDLVLENTHAA